MKLYATVTSERASKGQGGQNFIDAILKDEDREIASIHAIPDGDNTRISVYVTDKGHVGTYFVPTTKGERQKGESAIKY